MEYAGIQVKGILVFFVLFCELIGQARICVSFVLGHYLLVLVHLCKLLFSFKFIWSLKFAISPFTGWSVDKLYILCYE